VNMSSDNLDRLMVLSAAVVYDLQKEVRILSKKDFVRGYIKASIIVAAFNMLSNDEYFDYLYDLKERLEAGEPLTILPKDTTKEDLIEELTITSLSWYLAKWSYVAWIVVYINECIIKKGWF